LSRFRVPAFVAFALISAAVFVRLGVWQLHRRDERRARNALVTARLSAPDVDLATLTGDSASIRFRRVHVTGTPDYDHELIWASRSYKGSPGVNILTPIHVSGRDTAVIVDRGWVYAPDGETVDLTKWRDRDSVFGGYVEEFPSVAGGMSVAHPTVITRLGFAAVQGATSFPIAPVYIVMLGDSTIAPDRIARLSPPPLDEGPHLNYAIQWFAFAIIALVGAGVVLRQRRETRTDGTPTTTPAGGATDGQG
jgi:surfeit locus 1 family protein